MFSLRCGYFFLSILLVASGLFAKTENTAKLVKTTVLTENDAQGFLKIFGSKFENSNLSYSCTESRCQIDASIAGFSGDPVEELLRVRNIEGANRLTFESADGTFKLHCGRTSVAFCNIIQSKSVLD
jgi:hypothetical protein